VALPPKKPGGVRLGGPSGPDPFEPETGKEKLASERLADVLGELEEELEEVKVKYDMYFIGAERMEPARRRDDLKRNIERVRNAFTRNAGIRFRIQTLHARYLSYERLWTRSAREKEAGTYRRDLLKARRKAAEARGQKLPREGPGTARPAETPVREEAGPADVPLAAPTPAPSEILAPPPVRPPPLPARAPAAGMGEAELRILYESYVAAKRSCNEDASKVTLESLARTVNKQAPEIAARYKAKRVEFKVAIRDGRAVLTAVPKG
jgi:hypothetical protein